MKKLILLAAVACVAAVTTARAQKVYKDGNAIVLDLSVAAGMPAGAVTTKHKVFPSSAPLDNGLIWWSNVNLESADIKGSLNQTVYHKLEVASSNRDGGAAMYWPAAVNACMEADINGKTGWRLPTQRELIYIWIFREAIEGVGGDQFGGNGYWSVTEESETSAWSVTFASGWVGPTTKSTFSWFVRCVRELEP